MNKFFALALCILLSMSVTACKKDNKEQSADSASGKPVAQLPSLNDLAARSFAASSDWTRDISVYIDEILICSNAAPGQTKYIFHADAFETPAIALLLLKTEDDRVYACAVDGTSQTPRFQEVILKPVEKAPRFYPAELPKPDSCLNNTRILDKSGHTAGWLSKITC